MISDATLDPARTTHRPFRLRFSLLALLIFITLVCLALAWLVQPNRVKATALFRVSRQPPSILGIAASQPSEQDFEILKKTQLALLKSTVVLSAAARKPGVASLAVLQKRDPVEWLNDNLQVEFPLNSEILAITITGPEKHATDLAKLVDAVAGAYYDEVISKEQQQRLAARDLLAKHLSSFESELQDKQEVLSDIVEEIGASTANEATRELLMKRVDRIDQGVMRLEEDQLRSKTGENTDDAAFYDERLKQLRDRQAELEKALAAGSEPSAELSARKSELDQLRRTVDEVSAKLQRADIDFNSPPQIQQIQPAVVSPAD
jgi:myosin heavy subunit